MPHFRRVAWRGGRTDPAGGARARRGDGAPAPDRPPQHLAVVRALAKVSGARVEGDALDSTALTFEPGRIAAGAHRIDIEAIRGSAGSTTLAYEALLPLARAALPSTLTLTGAGGGVARPRPGPGSARARQGAEAKGHLHHRAGRANDVLARHRPEWALTDVRTGRPWVDNERLAGLDPFREEAWDYVIAVAREPASKGFQEIQFGSTTSVSPLMVSSATCATPGRAPTQAITGFLTRARTALDGTGALIALDIFGYVAFNSTDSEIGQRIEGLAPWVDVFYPMAYPSAYHWGIPGSAFPIPSSTRRKSSSRPFSERGCAPPTAAHRCTHGSRIFVTTPSTGGPSRPPRSRPRCAGPKRRAPRDG